MNKLKTLIRNLISIQTNKSKLYELVEYQLKDDTYRDGVRLLHPDFYGVVITIDPGVKIREVDDIVKILFDFSIEFIPEGMIVTKPMIHSIVGDIIVDLIQSDYNA